jgi:hypothetical protein
LEAAFAIPLFPISKASPRRYVVGVANLPFRGRLALALFD